MTIYKFDHLISSARAATNEDVETIIRICCLEPLKCDEWTNWVDENGNRLRIRTDRQVRIYSANKPRELLTTRDLYFKSPPKQIAKYSRWGLILHGNSAKSLAFLLGADDRLRLVHFEQEKWIGNRFPLEAGAKVLHVIACESKGKKNEICLPNFIPKFNFQLINARVVSGRNIVKGIANCQKAMIK